MILLDASNGHLPNHPACLNAQHDKVHFLSRRRIHLDCRHATPLLVATACCFFLLVADRRMPRLSPISLSETVYTLLHMAGGDRDHMSLHGGNPSQLKLQ